MKYAYNDKFSLKKVNEILKSTKVNYWSGTEGRNFEKDLKQEYLNGIQKGYAELLKQELPFPVKELNINELDFQRDKNAFQSILRSVFRASFL